MISILPLCDGDLKNDKYIFTLHNLIVYSRLQIHEQCPLHGDDNFESDHRRYYHQQERVKMFRIMACADANLVKHQSVHKFDTY